METSTATRVDAPATRSSEVGSREPAPEPAIAVRRACGTYDEGVDDHAYVAVLLLARCCLSHGYNFFFQ